MDSSNECPVCIETLENTVFYTTDGETWQPHKYCINCLNDIKNDAWTRYINNIKKADCEKSLKTCLQYGIPDRLTVDSSLITPVMKSIKFGDDVISTKLNMTISDDDLAKVNEEFKHIYDKMTKSEEIDYIGEINNVLMKYNL